LKGDEKIKKRKNEKENVKEKKKRKGIMDILLSHSPFTARRSCFARRSSKTDSASPTNPLHQHSHS
jgi:hypothetical protein